MVYIARFFGAVALFSTVVSALPRPRPDSAINEPAVSAPNGIPLTEGATPTPTAASSSCGSSGCGKMDSSPPPMMGSSSYSPPPMKDSGCGSSGCAKSSETTTSMMQEATTSAMMQETTTSAMMQETTTSSTMAAEATSTSMSMPMYGSGSSNWNMGSNTGYNDCVQQCLAQYSMPASTYTPPPPPSGTETASSASQTVYVTPKQGVLRFIPMAVNASVGETIRFIWNADNHTVTKGSALLPCNKSNESTTFATGIQKKGFTFDLTVNDTKPIFFYCAAPNHCQKGMFGVVNPASNAGSSTSVGNMMPGLIANNSNLAAYGVYAATQSSSSSAASSWGSSIDMSQFPDWAHEAVAENVMFMRAFLGSNKEVMQSDNSIDLSSASTTPLMIPQDPLVFAATSPSSSGPAGSTPVATPASASSTPSGTSSPSSGLATGGAASLVASRWSATMVAGFAIWLLL